MITMINMVTTSSISVKARLLVKSRKSQVEGRRVEVEGRKSKVEERRSQGEEEESQVLTFGLRLET